MTTITWTHPSVVRLIEAGITDDPLTWIERRSREVALAAMEEGWTGPPYDSFMLADALGIEVVARQDLDDARLVAIEGRPRIEFNPQRRSARVRFSIAHEIGHWLFEDYAERTRYRDMDRRRADDWQLELLCNIAAAEFLMPPGAFPIEATEDLNVVSLLDQRSKLGVSTEALLRRVVRLTGRAAALFAAARVEDSPSFRLDYVVSSRGWNSPVRAGDRISQTVLGTCTAVGYSDARDETWNDEELHVQAVGVPPYPGDRFPRVVGLIQPAVERSEREDGIRYVRGDAAEPRSEGPAIIAHVVNNQAQRWGGRGFANSLMDRYPDARDAYAAWSAGERRLGAVHLAPAKGDLWIASMVAQSGYGPSAGNKPRLRLGALSQALRTLAQMASQLQAAVHMPLIGTGQAGMAWPKVRDLIVDEVVDYGVPVTIYLLPDAPMPEEALDEGLLALL
jgi:Zn-dependent peptidase ImmA (M78 family)/O-acetyl-ADP-ribose deacetylase (regulator of RNase III)